MRWHTLSLGLMLGLGASPALASPDALLLLYGRDADYVSARDAVVRDGPGSASLDAALQHSDWRVRSTAGAIRRWREDPAAASEVWSAQPSRTRAGLPRFVDPSILAADNTPVLLERLLHGQDGSSVRTAVAEAIPRAGGDWAEAFVDLLDEERDPAVRAVLAGGLSRAPEALAVAGVERALHDAEPGVRLAALDVLGRVNVPVLDAALLVALDDASPAVRAEAAFVCGALDRAESWDAVRGLLRDSDAAVRLNALGAVQRLDPVAASRLAELGALAQDPDARVAALAGRVRAAK